MQERYYYNDQNITFKFIIKYLRVYAFYECIFFQRIGYFLTA